MILFALLLFLCHSPGGGNATLRGYDWKGEYIKRAKVEKQRRRMVFMMPAAPYIPPFPGFPGNMGPSMHPSFRLFRS